MTVTRGTTNGNRRGSSESRRRRRAWLVETFRADVDVLATLRDATAAAGAAENYPEIWLKACRCYRCGTLLTIDTVTVDRIIPGAQGGTYRRSNIRPACGPCNSETGGGIRRGAR